MNKTFYWKGLIIGTLVLICLALLGCNKLPEQPDIKISQIEAQNLDGNKIDFTNYIGKPLVVNYWATWCAPCINEFPFFEEVKQQIGNDVNFVMISDETIEKVKTFSATNSFTFNYLKSEKTLSEYDISVLPITYFFDSKGVLVAKHSTSLDIDTLTSLIELIK